MILANKKTGETPLELINRVKKQSPKLQNKPLTYAGRLDPLAEGLMLILAGKNVHKKDKLLKLNKTYKTTFLFGIETDTYDPLGLIQQINLPNKLKKSKLEKILNKLKKQKTFKYPPYSAKPVKGKPLWQWAKENKLHQINIPKHNSKIYQVKTKKLYYSNLEKLYPEIKSKIHKVKGDFRQSKILSSWKKAFTENKNKNLTLANLEIKVSSGTYIRQIAHLIGKKLSTGAIALNIKRTKIGKYKL